MLYYNADKHSIQQLTIVGRPLVQPNRTVRDWWLAIWHMINDDHDDEDNESWINQCYNCFSLVLDTGNYKKDGYRQQNVRQRQKIISIIDYDICMTFY